MKVGNKLLNRIVAVAMLAVVMLCDVSIVFASVKDYDSGNKKFLLQRQVFKGVDDPWLDDNGTQYNILYSSNLKDSDMLFRFIDVSGFPLKSGSTAQDYFVPVRKLVDGVKSFGNIAFYGNSDMPAFSNLSIGSDNVRTLIDGDMQYSYSVGLFSSLDIFKCSSSRCFAVDFDELEKKYPNDNKSVLIGKLLLIALGSADETSYCYSVSDSSLDDGLAGGQDNPIKKANFGYPDIYNSTYIHNDPNNLETLDKLYSGQDFQWNRKTTTGFDLTNNDYNYTYIECKVKANYQYNDKFSGKGDWHNFDSYGEMGNLGKVRAESLTHYYTFQEFQEALPKTSNELPDHKMRAIKSSAVYYFRVVCMKTSSTVVIPDEKDCKYYAGPWRSVNVGKINGKDGDSIIEDGDFDENGEWKKDDDSTDNGKDIDNGSAEGDDLNDASDKAHETINSNANKSTLDLDSAKAFINQVADVPKMIADIFSFLPDWVKYSFAFGFALIPIIIIYKLIRG